MSGEVLRDLDDGAAVTPWLLLYMGHPINLLVGAGLLPDYLATPRFGLYHLLFPPPSLGLEGRNSVEGRGPGYTERTCTLVGWRGTLSGEDTWIGKPRGERRCQLRDYKMIKTQWGPIWGA